MKGFLYFLMVAIFLSGCMTVRTYTVEKPRIDTEVEGNQGYLSGEPTEAPKENKFGKTRKVSVIELELGKRKPEKLYVVRNGQETAGEDFLDEVAEPEDVLVQEEVALEEYKEYVVGKNDTLQKISHKFYGTTRKWKLIYDNNADVLKSPDRIYPGIKIKIPVLD